ncbi:hypothetical protein RB213_014256 [Colletotrichum asianum]
MPPRSGRLISQQRPLCQRVNTILAQAGIRNGTYTANPDVNISNAASIARYSIEADLANPAHIVQLGNN